MDPQARKPHVKVSQDLLYEYLLEVGPQELDEIALVADISPSTARRKLDGLIFQRKVVQEVYPNVRLYRAVKKEQHASSEEARP